MDNYNEDYYENLYKEYLKHCFVIISKEDFIKEARKQIAEQEREAKKKPKYINTYSSHNTTVFGQDNTDAIDLLEPIDIVDMM